MKAQVEAAKQFQALHVPGTPLVLFNIWDCGSAKAVESSGARAIATSSWAVANANGFADGEQTPLDFAIDNLRRIVACTNLPVTIDLESGYGESPSAVGHSVSKAIAAGAVGCNLEDSFPVNGTLRPCSKQTARLYEARCAAEDAGVPLFINARTDVFFQTPPEKHDIAMVAETIDRAHAYKESGASGIFVPGLIDLALIEHLVSMSPLPVNILFGKATPPLNQLAQAGVARVSHGAAPYRAVVTTIESEARFVMFLDASSQHQPIQS